jgi:hypothetical protein
MQMRTRIVAFTLYNRRRRRGVLRTLDPSAFAAVGELERMLVQGYYGFGGQQPWTRRELARSHQIPLHRMDRTVRQLVSADVIPGLNRLRTDTFPAALRTRSAGGDERIASMTNRGLCC